VLERRCNKYSRDVLLIIAAVIKCGLRKAEEIAEDLAGRPHHDVACQARSKVC